MFPSRVPICPLCDSTSSTHQVVQKFNRFDYGHAYCRSCRVSFDDNASTIAKEKLDIGEIRSITSEEQYQKYFVEVPNIGDNDGKVYAAFAWDNNEELKAGVASHAIQALRRRSADSRFETMLDLGCGTGFTTIELSREFPLARLTAVDPSPEVTKVDGLSRIRAFQGTLDSLKFEAGSFDVVIIIGNLMLHTNPQATLAEAERILKPGGLLVIDFKNVDSLVRRVSIGFARYKLMRLLPQNLLERAFANMRYGFNRRAVRQFCTGLGLVELECFSKPPRLLEFSNKASLQRGLTGALWRMTDLADNLFDQRAWIQMTWRKVEQVKSR